MNANLSELRRRAAGASLLASLLGAALQLSELSAVGAAPLVLVRAGEPADTIVFAADPSEAALFATAEFHPLRPPNR